MPQYQLVDLGRFDVRLPLVSGGVGVVYEAVDRDTGATVAIKTLHGVTPEGLYRLKREFRLLQGHEHRNVCQHYELFEHDGRWFMSMECVRGEQLLHAVRDEMGNYDEDRLRDPLAQLAEALCAMHDAGLVHRDLKPSPRAALAPPRYRRRARTRGRDCRCRGPARGRCRRVRSSGRLVRRRAAQQRVRRRASAHAAHRDGQSAGECGSPSRRSRCRCAAGSRRARATSNWPGGRRRGWPRSIICGHGCSVLEGGIAARTRDASAIAKFREATQRAEVHDLRLHAAASRYQLGRLLGGTEGGKHIEEAAHVMTAETVVNPERFAEWLAPGVP